jgi:hypothetical protein
MWPTMRMKTTWKVTTTLKVTTKKKELIFRRPDPEAFVKDVTTSYSKICADHGVKPNIRKYDNKVVLSYDHIPALDLVKRVISW